MRFGRRRELVRHVHIAVDASVAPTVTRGFFLDGQRVAWREAFPDGVDRVECSSWWLSGGPAEPTALTFYVPVSVVTLRERIPAGGLSRVEVAGRPVLTPAAEDDDLPERVAAARRRGVDAPVAVTVLVSLVTVGPAPPSPRIVAVPTQRAPVD